MDYLEDTIHSGEKIYEKNYIWGQLIGWFKQTVDKPNASLSTDRRGTLSFPEISSFFPNSKEKELFTRKDSKKSNSNMWEYPFGTRNQFLDKLCKNYSHMWQTNNKWSYKNKCK
jgi:phage terminase large subunit GpA-like protein